MLHPVPAAPAGAAAAAAAAGWLFGLPCSALAWAYLLPSLHFLTCCNL